MGFYFISHFCQQPSLQQVQLCMSSEPWRTWRKEANTRPCVWQIHAHALLICSKSQDLTKRTSSRLKLVSRRVWEQCVFDSSSFVHHRFRMIHQHVSLQLWGVKWWSAWKHPHIKVCLVVGIHLNNFIIYCLLDQTCLVLFWLCDSQFVYLCGSLVSEGQWGP